MSLISEFKRRNVFRVTAAYLVIGWLVLQVSDILLDFTGAPEWVGKTIIALLMLGLVLTIVLTWVFEITPEGIRRDDGKIHAGDSARAQRLNLLTILAAVMVAAMFVWQQTRPPAQPTAANEEIAASATKDAINAGQSDDSLPTGVSAASIAVLPFVDLSPAGDQEYFSDGIAEEILNLLTRVGGLKVASRTSAFGFKGQEALGMPLIAEKLKVRHVLEGSVRKSGNMVRITAQIIDAAADQHLWSKTYDRELTTDNIFTIQDEIANAIVEQLAGMIGGGADKIDVGVKADTQDLDAYELYLEARALFERRNSMTLPVIIEKLESAVAIDPEFARAWEKLAASYSVAPSWNVRDRDYIALSNEAAKKAIELRPDLALPYAVLGSNLTEHPPAQFELALDYFAQALQRDPNDTTAILWQSEDYVATGFFEKAEQGLRRCLTLDPDYMLCKAWLAKTQFYMGNTETAMALVAEAVTAGSRALSYDYIFGYVQAGKFDLARWALARHVSQFDIMQGRSELIFRALTEEDFDFESGAAEYEIQYEAIHGSSYDAADPASFVFKKYADLTANLTHSLWWNRMDSEFLESPHRKRLIREAGIYDFWKSQGFPPQCRAIGDDDFECD